MESEELSAAAAGGRGIAANQRVCAAKGPVSVEELARGGAFDLVCFDTNTRRYVTRSAKAMPAGRRSVLRLHTDKGSFEMASEQAVVLQNGDWLNAGELAPGMRLCAAALKPEAGYLVRSADFGREQFALDHLTEADCAVANWYPVPSVELVGEAEVYEIEVSGPGAGCHPMLWSVGPGGGIGIAIAVEKSA